MKLFISLLIFTTYNIKTFAQADLTGEVKGFKVVNYDDKLDFALVLPALSKKQILDFNISSVLSSKIDTLRALGQKIEVPSNLSLPKQTERYFLRIKLKKPAYTLPKSDQITPPNYIGALQGRLPFNKTIVAAKEGAPLFSLINTFNFSSYSIFPVTGPKKDLFVNQEHANNQIYFKDVYEEKDYVTLGISFHQHEVDSFFPVDLRLLTPSSTHALQSTKKHSSLIVTIPESTFLNLKKAKIKAFPFSLVWNESLPKTKLPILDRFISISEQTLLINESILNAEFKILGYRLSLFQEDGKLIYRKLNLGPLPPMLSLRAADPFQRIRLDVFATDSNAPLFLKDETHLNQFTKFVSRYEIDI